jgi:hypothetical protein
MNVIPDDLHVDRQVDGGPTSGSVCAAIRMLRRGIESVAETGADRPGNARFELGGVVTVLARVPKTGHIRTTVNPADDFRLRLHDLGVVQEDGDLRDPRIAARILRTWLAILQTPETDAEAQKLLRSRRDAAQERVLRWWRAAAAARNRTPSRVVTFGWGTLRDATVEVTGYDHGNGPLDKGPNVEMAAHPALLGAPRSVCVIGSFTNMKIRQAITSVSDVGPADALTAMRDLGDPEIRHNAAFT